MLFASRGGERGQGAQISQKYSVVVNIPTTTTTTSTTALPTTTEQTLENATVDEVRFVFLSFVDIPTTTVKPSNIPTN